MDAGMDSVDTGTVKQYEKDRDIAAENWNAYLRARDGHVEFMRKHERCTDFYLGEQWDSETKERLAEQNRPALTINMILGIVNSIQGEYESIRHNVRFKPREDSDGNVATTLNKVFLAVQNATNFRWCEWQMFTDGIIGSRGFLDIRVDFDGSYKGDIKVRCLDPKDVLIDPQARDYDPRTWNEVMTTRWLSLDELEIEYGKEKRKKLEGYASAGFSFKTDSVMYGHTSTFGGEIEDHIYPSDDTGDDAGTIKRVRVVERQVKKIADCTYFVDPVTGDREQVPYSWPEEKVQQIAAASGFKIERKKERKVRWTVTADACVLHDDWSPYASFTICPFFPYFQRGRPMGVVENLLSLQEQLNKVESQELHVINTTSNSGYILDVDALANMDEDELARRGAETGLVLVRNPGKTIEKIQPNSVPTGLDRVGMKISNNFTLVSGINKSMLGQDSPELSGVALEHNKMAGLSQLQTVFTNLNRTRQIAAELILDLIQAFYTEERILRIVHDDDREDEEVVVNQMNAAGQVVNDLTVGKYDVVITTSPARDVSNETDFAEALALQQAGVPMPPDKLVQYSNLPDKEDVAKRIRTQLGVEPPTPEEQQMLEIDQQIAMKEKELMLAKLEAEVMELHSKAELNKAKAMDTLEGQNVRHADTLQQKTATAIAGDNLRRELSARSQLGQLEQTVVREEYKLDQIRESARNALRNGNERSED